MGRSKFNQIPIVGATAERLRNRVDVSQPSSSPSFPPYIRSLNPWLYWQLNDASHAAGATAADSASRCQTAPNNASWGGTTLCGPGTGGGVPQPPPNPGTYGANITGGNNITADGRATVKTAGAGAIASAAWSFAANAPICSTIGFWIATHFQFSTFAAQFADSDWLWTLPCNGNIALLCDLATDGVHDRIEVVSQIFGGGSQLHDWLVPAGTIGTSKHELIMRIGPVTYDGVNYHSIWTPWLDGVNLGAQDINLDNNTTAVRSANIGVQLGANLHAGDSYSVQDFVIMGAVGLNAVATDMTDGLATGFFNQWQAAGG